MAFSVRDNLNTFAKQSFKASKKESQNPQAPIPSTPKKKKKKKRQFVSKEIITSLWAMALISLPRGG